jgi:hypothetical protein
MTWKDLVFVESAFCIDEVDAFVGKIGRQLFDVSQMLRFVDVGSLLKKGGLKNNSNN